MIIFSHCSSDQQSTLVNEMASAAGFASQIDPLLLQTLQSLPKSDFEEEYLVSCLLMVFVAVSVPKLARSESSFYRVSRNSSVIWEDVSHGVLEYVYRAQLEFAMHQNQLRREFIQGL